MDEKTNKETNKYKEYQDCKERRKLIKKGKKEGRKEGIQRRKLEKKVSKEGRKEGSEAEMKRRRKKGRKE